LGLVAEGLEAAADLGDRLCLLHGELGVGVQVEVQLLLPPGDLVETFEDPADSGHLCSPDGGAGRPTSAKPSASSAVRGRGSVASPATYPRSRLGPHPVYHRAHRVRTRSTADAARMEERHVHLHPRRGSMSATGAVADREITAAVVREKG